MIWHNATAHRYCKHKQSFYLYMQPINLRSFKQKVRHHQKAFKKFLGKIEKKTAQTFR